MSLSSIECSSLNVIQCLAIAYPRKMINVLFLCWRIPRFKFDTSSVFTKSLHTFYALCVWHRALFFCDYILKEEEKGEGRVEENRGGGGKMKMTETLKPHCLQL